MTERPGTAPIGRLSARQEAVALLLSAGATLEEAARRSKVGSRTIRTWQHDEPGFRRRVAELRSTLTERTLGLLADASADAVVTLRKLLGSAAEATKLKAADAILSHDVRQRESAELREQVAALQEQLADIEAARRKVR